MTRKTPLKYARAPVCLGRALSLLAGCCGEKASSVGDSSAVQTVAADLVNASECGCAQRELFFARASLGLDPRTSEVEPKARISELRHSLENTASQGGSIRVLSDLEEIKRRLQDSSSESRFYATLIGRNGHFYGLHGAVNIDGDQYYQVSHGIFGVRLVAEEELNNGLFQECWLYDKGDADGVTIKLDGSNFVVDRLWENFGEAKPLATLQTSFTFKNDSEKTFVIGKPETSCGCVVPKLNTSVPLPPGENYVMDVEIKSGVETSFDQEINMKFWDEKTSQTVEFKLELFGNRRASMIASSNKIDFGRALPGEVVEREFNLKESDTDRFMISNFCLEGFEDINQALTIAQPEETPLPGGLVKRSFQLKLTAPNLEGTREGTLRISTTSDQYPVLSVPVVFTVEPVFAVSPNPIVFGDVSLGTAATTTFEITSQNDEKVEAKAVSLPDGLSLKKEGELYQLTLLPQKKGVWNETIELIIQNKEGTVKSSRSIKCTAFVR